jgi:replication factor C small subunit
MNVELWYEKYRPMSMNDYVWRDPQMRTRVEEWIKEGGLPHLLLSGVSGTGKTSLAYLALKMLDIPHEDILKINASRERKVEDLQDKVVNFISAWAFNPSGLKYIVLDEADKLSAHAQGLLRNEMETYANSSRFIMTCNYPNKIIPALHGRLQEIKFSSLDQESFINRAADVLIGEDVSFEPELLLTYYEKTYPDLRKCIGLLQQKTINGVLGSLEEDDEAAKDYLIQVVDLFKNGHILEARKLIIAQADPDDYTDLYRFFYENLGLFGDTQDKQDDALLIIRNGLVRDGQVADREINLSACLVELCRL